VSPLEGKAEEIIQLYHLPAIDIRNDPRFDCAGASWRRGGSTEQREIIDSRIAPRHRIFVRRDWGGVFKLANKPPTEPRRSQTCANRTCNFKATRSSVAVLILGDCGCDALGWRMCKFEISSSLLPSHPSESNPWSSPSPLGNPESLNSPSIEGFYVR